MRLKRLIIVILVLMAAVFAWRGQSLESAVTETQNSQENILEDGNSVSPISMYMDRNFPDCGYAIAIDPEVDDNGETTTSTLVKCHQLADYVQLYVKCSGDKCTSEIDTMDRVEMVRKYFLPWEVPDQNGDGEIDQDDISKASDALKSKMGLSDDKGVIIKVDSYGVQDGDSIKVLGQVISKFYTEDPESVERMKKQEAIAEPEEKCSYTIKKGDTLWSIAENNLENLGRRYLEDDPCPLYHIISRDDGPWSLSCPSRIYLLADQLAILNGKGRQKDYRVGVSDKRSPHYILPGDVIHLCAEDHAEGGSRE